MSRPLDPASGSAAPRAADDTGRREVMTLVFTDLVGSTRLKEDLGNTEALRLIREHHSLVRELLREYSDGFEISTAGDSFFLAFRRPSDAVSFALRLQARLHRWNRRHRRPVRDRVGIHTGEVTVEEDAQGGLHDLHGLEVDKCARVMSLGSENHILLTRFAFDNARASLKGQAIPEVADIQWASHGLYELKGVAEPLEICEVAESGRTSLAPPEDGEKAHRLLIEGSEVSSLAAPTGWRRWLAGRAISRRQAWTGAALTSVLGLLAAILVPALADLSYDLGYVVRRPAPPADAVIVKMDPESERELRQPADRPWDRRLHAQLLDRLREAGAKAVVFDVWFDDSADPEPTAALARALRDFPRTAMAGRLVKVVRLGVFDEEILEGPNPELAAHTRWGVSYFTHRLDQIIRQPYPGRPDKPHLAVEAARLIRGTEVPAPRGVWLNYYGPAGTFESFSYSQVLSNQVPADRLSGRIVFVGSVNRNLTGYTEGRLNDEAATPFTRWDGRRTPGVEIVATTTLNLVHEQWLRRTPVLAELALLAAAGVAFGFGLARLRPIPALTAAAAAGIVVALAGLTLTAFTRLWTPWMVVAAVQVPVALVWAVVAWAQGGLRSGGARGSVTARSARTAAPASAGASPSDAGGIPAVPDYSLLQVIGRGAYGEVWLARDAVGSIRAVKIVQKQGFSDTRPFEREFEGIRRFMPLSLEHPGLIRVFHVGRDPRGDFFHYVMEAADNTGPDPAISPGRYTPRTLAEDLQRQGSKSAQETARLGIDLAAALAFLHRHRLVHRDLKPANILYVQGRPKLADIGLVTSMAETDRSVTFLGTQGYIAPEGPGTAAADLYSLGKLLYVVATGRNPDEYPEPPAPGRPTADAHALARLATVWQRACSADPNLRPASADEFATELRAALVDTGPGAG